MFRTASVLRKEREGRIIELGTQNSHVQWLGKCSTSGSNDRSNGKMRSRSFDPPFQTKAMTDLLGIDGQKPKMLPFDSNCENTGYHKFPWGGSIRHDSYDS
ncbi:hypothetical protein KIN20_034012 [Parelaphostrongylus tenuis]|uniref:Uncharacterized protein n=1 Tax=Parelaphostrongylus tenuis TaxID=148309 RepID=A0AAD5R9G7_PARTN|nr:hypothetical protein KIN20_034012 [Parelaphostrongylus tenuis]